MVLCFWRVCANYLTRGFFLNLSDFVFLLMSSNFFSEKLDTTLPVSLRKGWEVWLLLFSHEVMSYSLLPHGLQNDRLPCPSLSPGVCAKSCPLSRWCHPTISSSAAPFSLCPQSFPAPKYFPVSQFFASGGQIIEASALAPVLPMNIQGWFLLGLTGLIFLLYKGLLRVFSSATVWEHQFFGLIRWQEPF